MWGTWNLKHCVSHHAEIVWQNVNKRENVVRNGNGTKGCVSAPDSGIQDSNVLVPPKIYQNLFLKSFT